MPDLPELYEVLDSLLREMLSSGKSFEYEQVLAKKVSALCAAIEVKQTQELHEMLNEEDHIEKWHTGHFEEKTTTTEVKDDES